MGVCGGGVQALNHPSGEKGREMSGVDFLRLALPQASGFRLQASGTPSLRSIGSAECVPQSCSVDYPCTQALKGKGTAGECPLGCGSFSDP